MISTDNSAVEILRWYWWWMGAQKNQQLSVFCFSATILHKLNRWKLRDNLLSTGWCFRVPLFRRPAEYHMKYSVNAFDIVKEDCLFHKVCVSTSHYWLFFFLGGKTGVGNYSGWGLLWFFHCREREIFLCVLLTLCWKIICFQYCCWYLKVCVALVIVWH